MSEPTPTGQEFIEFLCYALGYGAVASIVVAVGYRWARQDSDHRFFALFLSAALWPLTLFPAIALALVSRRRAAKLLRAVADYDRGTL